MERLHTIEGKGRPAVSESGSLGLYAVTCVLNTERIEALVIVGCGRVLFPNANQDGKWRKGERNDAGKPNIDKPTLINFQLQYAAGEVPGYTTGLKTIKCS